MPVKTKVKKSKIAVAAKPAVKSPFKGKSAGEVRTLIALDVLAQLKAKYYCAAQSVWVEAKKWGGIDEYCEKTFAPEDGDGGPEYIQASQYVDKVQKCSVCALGGVFMSQVRLGSDFAVPVQHPTQVFEDLDDSPLTKYFSAPQLQLIEMCFEGGRGMYEAESTEELLIAVGYIGQFPVVKDRLEAIMKNIVRNMGEFLPKQDLTLDGVLKAADIHYV